MQVKRMRESAPVRTAALPAEKPVAAICAEPGLSSESEEPPGSRPNLATPRHQRWTDVPLEQWEDWRWQMHNAVRTTRQLAELLPLPAAHLADLEKLEAHYKLVLPPYYLSLID